MTGVMVIEGDYDKQIKAFYDTYGGITGRSSSSTRSARRRIGKAGNVGSPGPYFSVNGRLQPNVTMKPGAVQFWRIANTSSRTTLILKVPPDLTWRQLAQDGVQFTDRNYKSSENADIVLASGNRADSAGENSAACARFDLSDQRRADDGSATSKTATQLLLSIKTIKSDPSDKDVPFMDPAPTQPPFLRDIGDLDITGRKTIVFATDRTPTFTNQTIDGKKFNGEVGALVLMNQVEEWKIVNASYAPQIAHPSTFTSTRSRSPRCSRRMKRSVRLIRARESSASPQARRP